MKKSPSFKSFVTSSVPSGSALVAMDSNNIRLHEEIIRFFETPESCDQESIDKLKALIESCEKFIDESSSNQREWVARVLIKMRFRLVNLKTEKSLVTECDDIDTNICGHIFKTHTFSHRSLCDHCTGTIWTYHKSYSCSKCNFNVHLDCLKSLTRVCVALIVAEKRIPELNICPEIGLYFQLYRCAECNVQFVADDCNFETRICHYTGFYYCTMCHWNDFSSIPANIVQNWDFTKKPVSRHSYQEINLFFEKPVIDLESVNPKLFIFVDKLRSTRFKRLTLVEMKNYLDSCKYASAAEMIDTLTGTKRYMVDNSNMYSIQDLVLIEKSNLDVFLNNLLEEFKLHILSCKICKAHGYMCEICNLKDPIFPFDDKVHKCEKCNACSHRTCHNRFHQECRKCVRISHMRADTFNI